MFAEFSVLANALIRTISAADGVTDPDRYVDSLEDYVPIREAKGTPENTSIYYG